MSELIAFLLLSIAVLLPGVLLVNAVLRSLPAIGRWCLGVVLGLGATVYLATAVSYLHLDWFWIAWICWGIAAGVIWFCRRNQRGDPVGLKLDRCLLLTLLLVGLSRFGLALWHNFPAGWDPTFHLILAKKIALSRQMIHDWSPFEQVALNYPVGSHCLVVIFSEFANLSLHASFKYLIPLIGILTTAQVYCFGLFSTQNRCIARYSAIAYGVWAIYGSMGYAIWGGLPNALGMVLLLSMLILLLIDGSRLPRAILFGVLCAAMILAHHHVMLISGVLLGVLLVYYLLKRQAETAWILVAGSVLGFLLAGFHTIPYLIKTLTIGSTMVMRQEEQFFNLALIGSSLGWLFFVVATTGFVWYSRHRTPHVDPLVVLCTITLLGLFIFFEYAYRLLAFVFTGNDWVAMTPSRFLTDAVCFLAIFAGIAWERSVGRCLGPACAGGIAIALAATTAANWFQWIEEPMPPQDFVSAAAWIERNTGPSTVVLTEYPWASYLTWRRTLKTPIPISEPFVDPEVRAREMVRILQGKIMPDSNDLVLLMVLPAQQVSPGSHVLWRNEHGGAIVQVWPAKSRLTSSGK